MSPYAEGTHVEAIRTRVEIERLLQRQQCSHVGVLHEPGHAIVYFQRGGWAVQMRIPLPGIEQAPTRKPNSWRPLPESQRVAWVEQRTRERWRQLLLVLKAKFTALETSVETFEESFLAHLVIGGAHLGERLLPAVRQAQERGTQLLLGSGQ